MRIIVCDNYEELSKKAAKIVASQITLKPESVIGLATGSTPIGMYNELSKMCKSGDLDFSEVVTFNLDEYYPIKKNNNQSYDYFMKQNLFSKINIKPQNIHIPNGEAKNPQEECEEYEKSIRANGGIDLQILGIGQNGHIGFNEPDSNLSSLTHLTKLTENTIKANSRFFESMDEVPKEALTMGIGTILKARKIVILANGANKRRVVTELVNGGINTKNPASMLKTHPDVTLICDKEAYSGAKLGIDIGGTNIKLAVIDSDEIVYKGNIKTPKTESGIINTLCDTISSLKDSIKVTTVGVGTPGIIKGGKVTATNLPFKETPLENILKERTGLCVTVDNDANCAALGEVTFGNTKDCDNIVLVSIGTGIGGGIVMDREICRTKNNMGEIGHLIIQAENGRECPCGQTGCWEQYSSMTALIKDTTKAAIENPDSILGKMYAENNEIDGKMLFDALEQNCEVAEKVFEKYIKYLALGINSLVNIFGPDAIVLSGGVTNQGDRLLLPLKEKVKKDIRIEISTLQKDAGALGACVL